MKRLLTVAGILFSLALSFFLASPKGAVAFAWNDMAQKWNNYLINLSLPLESRPVCSVNTPQKVVAITLDDGPNPLYTLPVLDILKERNIKATFFMVGSEAAAYPEIVKQINQQGHEIANHTMTHPEMQNLSPRETVMEIKNAGEVLEGITRNKTIYFRPPKGVINAVTLQSIHQQGYTTVLWDVALENKKCKTPGEMARRVIKMVKPGSIILLHDGRLDRTKTVQSLPFLLDGLKETGYSFVTISDLLTQEQNN